MTNETDDLRYQPGRLEGDGRDGPSEEFFTVPEPDGVESGVPFESQTPGDTYGDKHRQVLQEAAPALSLSADASRTLGGMPLKRKLMLSFGLLTMVILILGVVSLGALRNISVHGIAEIGQHADLARLSNELHATIALIGGEEQNYLLLEDSGAPRRVARYSARAAELIKGIGATVAGMEHTADSFSAEQLSAIRAAAADYGERFAQLAETVDTDRVELAAQDADTRAAAGALRAGLDATIGEFDALLEGLRQRQGKGMAGDGQSLEPLLQSFAGDLATMGGGLAAYVAGLDPSYPELARATFGEALAQLELLREQSTDSRLKRDLGAARKALLAHSVLLRETAAQRAEAADRAARLEAHIDAEKDALHALGSKLSERTEALSVVAWREMAEDSAMLTAMGTGAQWLVGITAVIGVGVGLLVLVTIPRPISTAIGQLVDGAQRIARGDLGTPIWVRSRDELGLLANTFEHMRTNLSGLVRRIQRSAVQLSSSINEIQAAATQQAASSSEQASAVNELSASLNEMSQSAATLLSSAENVGSSVDGIADIVAGGNEKSEAMMRSMDAIGTSTRQTAERIKSLSDRMDDINGAVTTISGVADQTTLLSLNASIEANKAGEMGKGFAVVAHEIRRLADRSIDSAGNINAMVRDIQRATESSALAMDKSSEEIRHGVVLVGESAGALVSINDSMERIQEQMSMILESVRAQAESSRMVQSTSTQMLSSANMVSKAASQTRSVTHDLNTMAAQLSAAVAAFST
ncbi:methyl-accepting chemotaxis protein [Thiorhodococcus mannitoliphagus]|uniref:Methyl-accepting chemotaxis protein n=1 Tax=Thiorhodococcus mannitoliphagus TaxID=329406 RepID=A0A6P1DV37_9GAMM|nr:methyl-accepting chemotaxis protein [Thiorhodococcus mannitoliphagus]NEX21599.1 methyl-accepting chemotaxis protein [Thiorhodococcus mannitoliphagus]